VRRLGSFGGQEIPRTQGLKGGVSQKIEMWEKKTRARVSNWDGTQNSGGLDGGPAVRRAFGEKKWEKKREVITQCSEKKDQLGRRGKSGREGEYDQVGSLWGGEGKELKCFAFPRRGGERPQPMPRKKEVSSPAGGGGG